MSYFHYLACNRELPTGHFGFPPKAIYNSYMAYRHSNDYVVPINFMTGKPKEIDGERRNKLERLKGKVVVFQTSQDARGFVLEPYSPIITHRGAEVFEPSRAVMSKHFSLPHLYNLFMDSEETLIEYLCKYLVPGDQVEVYTCWTGEETLERSGEDRIVDLEDVVCGRYTPNQTEIPGGNHFTRYLAPSAPQEQNMIGPIEQIDHVVMVIQDIGLEGVALFEVQAAGADVRLMRMPLGTQNEGSLRKIRKSSASSMQRIGRIMWKCVMSTGFRTVLRPSKTQKKP